MKYGNPYVKHESQRYWVGVIASILLGVILISSGVGKLFMNLPNETEFLENLAPIFRVSENQAMLVAYALPWVELLAGLLLLLQVWPSIVAIILCVPLVIGFAINNLWMIFSGIEYDSCNSCFGELEKIFGSLSPIQSFSIDVIMFILVIVIVFVSTRYKLLYGLLDKSI